MKNVSKLLVGLSLAGASAAVMAQSIDVKVIGKITPGACVPTIAGGGTIDYGNIAAKTLDANAFSKLADKQVDFTIACDAATKVALKVHDNRSASRVMGAVQAIAANYPDTYAYGLGTVGGKNIGSYVIRAQPSTFTGDGASLDNVISVDSGATWSQGGSTTFVYDGGRMASFAATGTTAPVAHKNFAGKIGVQAVLNKGSELPLTQEIPLDGSATMELVYL